MKLQCRYCRLSRFTSCISHHSHCRSSAPASVLQCRSLFLCGSPDGESSLTKQPNTFFSWSESPKQNNKTISTFLTASCFAERQTTDATTDFRAVSPHPCATYRHYRILGVLPWNISLTSCSCRSLQTFFPEPVSSLANFTAEVLNAHRHTQIVFHSPNRFYKKILGGFWS